MVEQRCAGMLDRADKEIAEALGVQHGAARLRPAEGSGPGTRRNSSPDLRFLRSGRRDSNPRPPPWQGGSGTHGIERST